MSETTDMLAKAQGITDTLTLECHECGADSVTFDACDVDQYGRGLYTVDDESTCAECGKRWRLCFEEEDGEPWINEVES